MKSENFMHQGGSIIGSNKSVGLLKMNSGMQIMTQKISIQ